MYRTHTKESIIEDIKRFKRKHGRYPTWRECEKDDLLPGHKTIKHHFNMKYSDFMKTYFEITPQYHFDFADLSEQDIVDIFRAEYNRIKPKNAKEYNLGRSEGTPTIEGICRKLSITINQLKRRAGIEVKKVWHYSDEEILKQLTDLSNDLERTPSVSDIEMHLKISDTTIKKRFGSYNNAIRLAELDPNSEPVSITETNEELLGMYKDFSNDIGRMATATDLNNSDEIYNVDVFTTRFGGMYELQKAAGFEPNKTKSKIYSKAIIKDLLLKAYHEKGTKLTNKEIDDSKKLPSLSTILRYYKTTSMQDVWKMIL